MLGKLKNYIKYKRIENEFISSKNITLPLCAAENRISEFAKLPLSSDYQERYIMNGLLSYQSENNFIGSEPLYEIYKLIHDQCNLIFQSEYTDARTLSGMNCVTALLMSLTQSGDKIMISSGQSGGHPSMESVCKRLGLQIIDMPYNYSEFNMDYDRIFDILKKEQIRYFLFAPSDLIDVPDYRKLRLPENTVFLYDASQTLGLIAGKAVANPLVNMNKLILFGGTHKTIPGPAKGLIMTNDKELAEIIDRTISPHYIRHTQMHQVASLLFTLFEMEAFGEVYVQNILDYADRLGRTLSRKGMNVPFIRNRTTFTHQVFIKTSQQTMNSIFHHAFKNNVTLNKKHKKLFGDFGIRLGTQELARLNWSHDPIEEIAEIVYQLQFATEAAAQRLNSLSIPQELRYTFLEQR